MSPPCKRSIPLALEAKFCGEGLLGLMPWPAPGVIAADDAVTAELTPETMAGSSESKAMPDFLPGIGGEVVIDALAVGAGLIKLGII